jgi:uncharacterized protein YecE (DUF72 family)
VLRVGCAMWAYKAWQGLHFPVHLARREQFGVYASWCNAVEGNTTFYGLPASRTVAAWAAEAPEGFRFVFKLPRAITHEHHLRDVAADHRQFLERIAPLGDGAEQLAIQLPPSFGPADVGALAAFVRSLPRSHRYAVELRHHAFSDDPQLEAHVEQLLGEHDVEWISLDTTTLYSEVPPNVTERGARRQKPHLPRRLRALTDHPVVRFVGTDDTDQTTPDGNRGYRSSPDGSARAAPPPCSSTPQTTSPRRSWPDACTTTSAAKSRPWPRSPSQFVPPHRSRNRPCSPTIPMTPSRCQGGSGRWQRRGCCAHLST